MESMLDRENDSESVLSSFSGITPLFPLAHPTLFPGLVQPFQIFEPRYREMTRDVLSGERLIAMTVLKPRWETKYESKGVPVQPVVCLGRVTVDEKLPDGRYMLMIRGLCRAEIVHELETDRPYRNARLRILDDVVLAQPKINREQRRLDLINLFQQLFPGLSSRPSLLPLLQDQVPFGVVCDLIAFAMHLSPSESYAVLAESNVDLRSERILRDLQNRLHSQYTSVHDPAFPPMFSAN
jgi:Lon protease-like protein